MKTITLQLPVETVNTILGILGEMPTKSGAFPVMQDITAQRDQQLKEEKTNGDA